MLKTEAGAVVLFAIVILWVVGLLMVSVSV